VDGCIFCAIVNGTAPSRRIYEDEHTIAFMDINPATDGHALVIPRAHVRDLWDIDEPVASKVMAASVRVASMMRKALEPDGINILHATGAAAFQTIFHFHLHVIPRYRGDPIKLPWVPRPGDRTKIDALAEKIANVAR
jgi:histidine triad (HIT) family protein